MDREQADQVENRSSLSRRTRHRTTSSRWLMAREMAEPADDSSGKSIGMRGRRFRERSGVRSIKDDLCVTRCSLVPFTPVARILGFSPLPPLFFLILVAQRRQGARGQWRKRVHG
jgi:hypothetical protein